MKKYNRTERVEVRKGGPGGRGHGRPPMFVVHDGTMVQGLSYHAKSERFYATYPCVLTSKRVYFGYEIDEAVKAFKRWKREQKKHTLAVA